MPALTKETRAELLDLLKLNAGQAESGERPGLEIFPIAEHIRALEPQVVLVVGDRGSGKTQLKNALTDVKLRKALARQATSVRAPDGEAEWLTGWPLSQGPDQITWREFARRHQGSRENLVRVWLAYFVRSLVDRLDVASSLHELRELPLIEAERFLATCKDHGQEFVALIDALDAHLQERNRWLVIAYDELDTVVLDDWEALGTIIRGLVTMWASYARRWQRVRPKIFLRTDFYRHHREIAGADVAKLAANRVELSWSDKNLYGALIKHIVNKDEELRSHLGSTLDLSRDAALGWIPRLASANDARKFIHRLVGEFMGADRKKGDAFKWILDHLRDGNKRALPRTLVWLIEFAAERERADMRATGARLLHHVSLRNALDRVSDQYVQQTETNEFVWLPGLRRRLERDREVPWSRKELERLLNHEFAGSWSTSGDVRPPGIDPSEVLENLIELGLVRARPDGLVDVPDLYLSGLGLKRKGGVARE